MFEPARYEQTIFCLYRAENIDIYFSLFLCYYCALTKEKVLFGIAKNLKKKNTGKGSV